MFSLRRAWDSFVTDLRVRPMFAVVAAAIAFAAAVGIAAFAIFVNNEFVRRFGSVDGVVVRLLDNINFLALLLIVAFAAMTKSWRTLVGAALIALVGATAGKDLAVAFLGTKTKVLLSALYGHGWVMTLASIFVGLRLVWLAYDAIFDVLNWAAKFTGSLGFRLVEVHGSSTSAAQPIVVTQPPPAPAGISAWEVAEILRALAPAHQDTHQPAISTDVPTAE